MLYEKNLFSTPNGSLKPFWDLRYTNSADLYIKDKPANYANHAKFTGLNSNNGSYNRGMGTSSSKYDASGSMVQSECVNGHIAAGSMLNLWDSPYQTIEYGGVASTFTYVFNTDVAAKPWLSDGTGNLMLQGYFERPLYYSIDNEGAQVNFNIFLSNKEDPSQGNINYVINIYTTLINAPEMPTLLLDPTTNAIHIGALISTESNWVTKSPYSQKTKASRGTLLVTEDHRWDDFYRVNISYSDLQKVLILANKPLNPEDWVVTSIAVQNEIGEDLGYGSFANSFIGFSAYTSNAPM